jgi:hypothetical protein
MQNGRTSSTLTDQLVHSPRIEASQRTMKRGERCGDLTIEDGASSLRQHDCRHITSLEAWNVNVGQHDEDPLTQCQRQHAGVDELF